MKRTLMIAGVLLLTIGIGSNPRKMEEVQIGGGYGDAGGTIGTDAAGGVDIEADGDILTNGNLTMATDKVLTFTNTWLMKDAAANTMATFTDLGTSGKLTISRLDTPTIYGTSSTCSIYDSTGVGYATIGSGSTIMGNSGGSFRVKNTTAGNANMQFYALDNKSPTPEDTSWGGIWFVRDDATDGTEDGRFEVGLVKNGAFDYTVLKLTSVGDMTLDGNCSIASGKTYQINSVQIASTNLSDTANIGMLNEAETLAGNWVNTTNPWADNEVADALTINGGTITNTSVGAGGASSGAFTTLSVSSLMTTSSGVGAIVSGKCTVSELCGTSIHKTYVTFTLTGANDLDLADGDHGTGVKVYDFPEGYIKIIGATCDGVVTSTGTTGAFPMALGTATGADDNTLTGTEADIIPSTAITNGASQTFKAVDAVDEAFDGTSTAIGLYVNAACTDGANSGAVTIAVTGTATVTWISLGDY